MCACNTDDTYVLICTGTRKSLQNTSVRYRQPLGWDSTKFSPSNPAAEPSHVGSSMSNLARSPLLVVISTGILFPVSPSTIRHQRFLRMYDVSLSSSRPLAVCTPSSSITKTSAARSSGVQASAVMDMILSEIPISAMERTRRVGMASIRGWATTESALTRFCSNRRVRRTSCRYVSGSFPKTLRANPGL